MPINALAMEPATLNVHIEYEYEAAIIAGLKERLLPGVVLTVGEDPGADAAYHVLVSGRPSRDLLNASPNLHTMIVPWVGISPETRALLAEYPHIALHNLHHNAAPTAELAIALLLAAAKVIIPYDSKFRAYDWTMRYERPGPSLLLDGKTALILGYGAIGRRVAAACKGLGMKTVAVKRHAGVESDETADEIHPLEALHTLLPRAGALLICLPLTPQTEKLIGEKELALLPEKCVLVNVGRGPIVDQAALYSALRDGRLHSAGLDVWYEYPPDKASRAHTPPAAYPFHKLKNVVMSPHRGGDTLETDALRMAHLARILNSILEGKPAPNRVDLEIGY